MSSERDSALIGQSIGNVQIVSRIGKGGVGVVYRAEHQQLGTPYAVKVLNDRYSKNKVIAERFRREAIACGRLHHPNVVFVTDFGFKEGIGIYIIMELLEGEPLERTLQREGQLDCTRAGRIALQICSAMEAAHRLGITHRDLKPANIHVRPMLGHTELVKVLDFGIARVMGQSELTATGTVVGSPHYMSPEQVQGFTTKIGPPSDVYALGIVLYQMLAGTWPIWDDDMFTLCYKQVSDIPDPISDYRPELRDTALEDLVARMLAKAIEDRPQSMREVGEALSKALAELGAVEDIPSFDIDFDDEEDKRATTTTEMNPARFQALHLLNALRTAGDDSPLADTIDTLTDLSLIEHGVIRMMAWGVASAQFMAADLDTPTFLTALDQIVALMDSTLVDVPDPYKHAFHLALEAVLIKVDKPRQNRLLTALQPLMSNPQFPTGIVPTWATVQTSGTWKHPLIVSNDSSLEGILGDDQFESWDTASPSLNEYDLSIEGSGISGDEDTEDELPIKKTDGLLDKLRRPVSLKNVRNVLSHKVRRGSRKEDKP